MSRSTDAQKAERLNAAHRLLARGQSVGEAALSLSRQFGMSRRQAYRYIEEAQLIGRPVPVVEAARAVTFKLPPSLVDAVRARAAAEGTTISDMVIFHSSMDAEFFGLSYVAFPACKLCKLMPVGELYRTPSAYISHNTRSICRE